MNEKKGGLLDEKNLSAEKIAAQKSTRLYEKNGWQKRQKSAGSPPCKGQKKTDPLSFLKNEPHGILALWECVFMKKLKNDRPPIF